MKNRRLIRSYTVKRFKAYAGSISRYCGVEARKFHFDPSKKYEAVQKRWGERIDMKLRFKSSERILNHRTNNILSVCPISIIIYEYVNFCIHKLLNNADSEQIDLGLERRAIQPKYT